MPVMRIRVMLMPVRDRRMAMPMRVARGCGNGLVMRVVMMLVASAMRVLMAVFHRLVGVQMLLPVCQMQRHAHGHQSTRDQQLGSERLPLPPHPEQRAP